MRSNTDPPWARPALLTLLGVAGLLYLWGLGASGWANSYYTAAVQGGTESWKAFLFGSFDASNFITIDKTPASLWVMGISARLFGVNAWSILVPQALEGIAAVALLYATLRRWFGPAAGLVAGTVMALTPVAALMFRFNNPDALLVLLLTGGAYATTRALEDGRTRWLALAGACVGFGFLTKELQAFLVLPAFAGAYLLAGPPRLARRLVQVVVLGATTVLSAGWWVALVVLTSASDRPYVGGSQDNTFWNVLFGYNGFGRLTGDEPGSVGPGGRGISRWGVTGWTRLFGEGFGGQISWLLPAALVLLIVGIASTWHRPRTDGTRAALVLWGGWLLVTGVVFSLSRGIVHEYYSVALAPAIGALVGIGVAMYWPHRRSAVTRALWAALVVVTAGWSYTVLVRTPEWVPWLRSAVLIGGLGVTASIALAPRLRGRAAVVLAAVTGFVTLAAPAAYTLVTVTEPHSGAIPVAGPASVRVPGARGTLARVPGAAGGGPPFANGGAPRAAPGGGLLNATEPGPALTALLEQVGGEYRWAAATVGANSAAGYQLASGEPIMAIGGFNGTDPVPTLAEFQDYVRNGAVRYFLHSGGFGGGRSEEGTADEIRAWVAATFEAQTVDGVTVYDLASNR